MNKAQIEYAVSKIRTQLHDAQKQYEAKHQPIYHSRETLEQALKEKGFIVNTDRFFRVEGVQLPPTREMEVNMLAIKTFKDKSSKAASDAIDAIYLGDSKEATELLATFSNTLAGLAA